MKIVELTVANVKRLKAVRIKPDGNLVVIGGESGPNARPCDVAWIRSIVQQCKAAGVPVFVKQLGAAPFELVENYACEDDTCQRCGGRGEIVTCIDDLCYGQEECIHGDGYSTCPDAWDRNDWVWALTFKRVEAANG